MNDRPFITVVVPTFHRIEFLRLCLQRLAPGVQYLDSTLYEIIVTDDGYAQMSESLVQEEFSWVKWTLGPRRGPAANRNHGAGLARGQWLVFTDDDCLPEASLLSAYADAIRRHPDCRVFEGRTYADLPQQSLADRSPTNETGGKFYSCNCLVRTSLFHALGGFDERFREAAMEDLEFAYRIRAANEEITFVPTAAVCHPWRDAGGWRQLRMMNAGILTYLTIHPSEFKKINPKFYLKASLWIFFHEVLRALFRQDWRGLTWSSQKLFSTLHLSLQVFCVSFKRREPRSR